MYPNTAHQLKEGKYIPIKSYLNAAKVFNVSHLILLTNTEKANYIKFAKLPDGPTLTYRIENFSLSRYQSK